MLKTLNDMHAMGPHFVHLSMYVYKAEALVKLLSSTNGLYCSAVVSCNRTYLLACRLNGPDCSLLHNTLVKWPSAWQLLYVCFQQVKTFKLLGFKSAWKTSHLRSQEPFEERISGGNTFPIISQGAFDTFLPIVPFWEKSFGEFK